MRLLQVIASSGIGGAEMHVGHIVRAVPAEHTVIHLSKGPAEEKWREAGARTIFIEASGKMPRYSIGPLKEAIEAVSPDLVHSHTPKANLIAAAALARSRIPMVMTVHGSYRQFRTARRTPSVIYLLSDAVAARRATRVIAVCEADRHYLVSRGFGRRKTVTIPNGIPDPGVMPPPSPPVRIAWIGRLSPEKGIETLVEVARAMDGFPGYGGMTIVGSGPEGDKVWEKLGETASVRIRDATNDLDEVFAEAAIFLSTSLSEGASLTILEAMARGRAVVATGVGGTPEILSGSGILVTPGEPHGIAAALKRLVSSPDLIEGSAAAARRRFDQNYTIEMMGSRLSEVYHSSIAGKIGA